LPKIARITGVIALLLPTAGIPLGLGDIELHSALNQPLNADIGLLDINATSLDRIQVSLAGRDEFEKLGLDRPSFLSSIKMELRKDESGRQFINLSSTQAIREPFVDVLLAVSWPQGRLVKEYTMLLDPPVFLDAPAAPVNAPATGVTTTERGNLSEANTGPVAKASTPASSREAASVSPKPGFSREADGALSYGPVQRSDTLWSIAQTYKGEDGVSAPQIMMALLRDNPEAFYDKNVNELKAGYVLRIRHTETISAMSQAAAEAEIRRQYSVWRAAKEGRPLNVPVEPDASSGAALDTSVEDGVAGPGPHLELASAESGNMGATAGVATDGAAVGKGPATRADLLAAIEATDVAQQENKALRERLAILEKQMANMRRLLVLKGDTLTALQANGTEAVVPSQDIADVTADNAETAQPDTNKTDTTAVVAAAADAEKKATPVTEPVAEEGLLDQLLGEYWWYALSGGGVLLLLLALLAKRRQGMKDDIDLAAGYSDAEEAVVDVSVPASASEEVYASSETESEEGAVTAATLLDDVQSSQYGGSNIDDEDIDTLSEADVYLAYRRFDKAEHLLSDALQQEPDRHDLQLKLLEVYAKSENKEAFVLRAEALQVLLNDDESEVWSKVTKLGQPLLGNHPLFGGDEVATDAVVEAVPETQEEPEAEIRDETTDDQLDAMAASFEEAFPSNPVENPVEDVVASDEDAPESEVAESDAPALDIAPTEFSESEAEMAGDAQNMADHRDIPLEFEIASLEQRLDSFQEDETETGVSEADVSAVSSDALDNSLEIETHDEAPAPDVVASDEREETAESETDMVEDKAKSDDQQGDDAQDDMGWLDEVVDSDLDDLIGDGEDMAGLDDDMDLAGPISGEDNFATNLDLARAYIDMGDMEAARAILEGLDDSLTEMQRVEIQELMKQIA